MFQLSAKEQVFVGKTLGHKARMLGHRTFKRGPVPKRAVQKMSVDKPLVCSQLLWEHIAPLVLSVVLQLLSPLATQFLASDLFFFKGDAAVQSLNLECVPNLERSHTPVSHPKSTLIPVS